MAYCVNTDVTAMFPGMTFSASGTKITTGQIDTWIVEFSAIIDGQIVGVYVVPVTGTESLKVLKEICRHYVAAQVMDILTAGASGRDNPVAERWRKYALDMLDKIISGDVVLTDATKVKSDITLTGKLDEDGEEREPYFKIDQKF